MGNESCYRRAAEAEGKEKAEAFRRLRGSFATHISGQAIYIPRHRNMGDIIFKIIS